MLCVSGVTVFVSFFAVLRVSDVPASVGSFSVFCVPGVFGFVDMASAVRVSDVSVFVDCSFVASLAPPVAITGIKGAAKTDTMPHKDETVPG